jgi:restriction system protein
MALPTYVQFIGPLLEYLGEQQGPVRPRVVYEELARRLGISEEDRKDRLPSGAQTVLANRLGWAHDALKRAGLSSSPVRGTWLITEAGRKLLQEHASKVSQEEMVRIGSLNRDVSLRTGGASVSTAEGAAPGAEDLRSPREEIEAALAQIRSSVVRDLLENIAQQSSKEFEDLVLEVLHKLGYGMSREALQRVGRAGDGGIDGVIALDPLGLQKVYVQAKKWQGQVGSPQVQGFVGALQLQGADKGVLITCGDISKPARAAAKQAPGIALVLIDGEQLATLMIERGVGVTSEELKIPKVDSDYFEGE